MTALAGGVAACCAVMLFGSASAAWAGPGLAVPVNFPQNVSVGQSGLAASLAIINTSEDSPPNPGGEYQLDSYRVTDITLIPSCRSNLNTGAFCQVPDPGVFAVSATGTGQQNSACAGVVFDTLLLDAATGTYRFTPRTDVTLGPAASNNPAITRCGIDFTVSVLRMPASNPDAAPAEPGIQTEEKAGAAAIDVSPGDRLNQTSSGAGSDQPTFTPGTLPIRTQVNPDTIRPSDTFRDTAFLTPTPGAAVPTGTVTFRAYGPDNATCAGAPAFSSTNPLNATGTSAQSDVFTPTVVGTYRVIATYNGDGNYSSVSGVCGATGETVVVSTTAPPPGATTTPPPPPPPAAQGVSPASEVCVAPGSGSNGGTGSNGAEVCARGTAAIKGRTGCQGRPFNVLVSGRQIERVIFSLDGKVVRTLTRPNSGTRYKLPVSPARLGRGTHRVLARTVFSSRSATKSRTLRVTFSRCARRAVSPAFTG